jgi:hypothetical protein
MKETEDTVERRRLVCESVITAHRYIGLTLLANPLFLARNLK